MSTLNLKYCYIYMKNRSFLFYYMYSKTLLHKIFFNWKTPNHIFFIKSLFFPYSSVSSVGQN